jgi:hypothetical protein
VEAIEQILKEVGSIYAYDFGEDESTKLQAISQRSAFGEAPLHFVCRWGDVNQTTISRLAA